MRKLKRDLQQIVVSAAYAEQNLAEGSDAIDSVRSILLDETGFWTQMEECIDIMTPVVSLLRLMDGTAPAMGKIVPRLAAIGQMLEKSSVTWRAKAIDIHQHRTKYLLSPMHQAGYALDPEFLDHDMTEDTQTGLILVTERLCLRDVMSGMQSTREGRADAAKLTTDSRAVQSRVADTMMQVVVSDAHALHAARQYNITAYV